MSVSQLRALLAAGKVLDLGSGAVLSAAMAVREAAREDGSRRALGDESTARTPASPLRRKQGFAARGSRTAGAGRKLGRNSASSGAAPAAESGGLLARFPWWAKTICVLACVFVAGLYVTRSDGENLRKASTQLADQMKHVICEEMPGIDREFVAFLVDRHHEEARKRSYVPGKRWQRPHNDEKVYAETLLARIGPSLARPRPEVREAFRQAAGRDPNIPDDLAPPEASTTRRRS